MNEVEIVLGSELDPVKVAINTTLSGNNLGSKVDLGEKPAGVENVL
jgi:hypothetical protein